MVLPIDYVLRDEEIVVNALVGSRLEAALRDAVVGFEADDIDPITQRGWSVSVTGFAHPTGMVPDGLLVRPCSRASASIDGPDVADIGDRRTGDTVARCSFAIGCQLIAGRRSAPGHHSPLPAPLA